MANRKSPNVQGAAEIEAPVFNPTRLRQAAAEKGLTQEAVARATGYSMRGVQKWFLGDGSPKGDALIVLARLLDKEPGWFYESDPTDGKEAA